MISPKRASTQKFGKAKKWKLLRKQNFAFIIWGQTCFEQNQGERNKKLSMTAPIPVKLFNTSVRRCPVLPILKVCGTRHAHKADCTQECHLFISTKHPLTPFVKPCKVLNLAVQNIFYVQPASMYNPVSTKNINNVRCTSTYYVWIS